MSHLSVSHVIFAAELVTFLVTAVKGSLFPSGGQSPFCIPTRLSLMRLLLGTTILTSSNSLFLPKKWTDNWWRQICQNL